MMKRSILAPLLVLVLVPAASPQPSASTERQRVAYFYKVRWGFQQEFERLFLKNHYPILMEEKKAGRIREVHLFRPTFHGDGRSDWTFLVAITYASWSALGAPSQENEIARRLFPDQETFRKEEQRRFELLEAHWDVPLKEIPPSP